MFFNPEKVLNIEDLRELARRRLPKGLFEFCDRGSEDDIALQHNRTALQRIKLRSRVLNNTSSRHTQSEFFGGRINMPVIIGPTGPAGFVWYRGELALAKAAKKAGIPFALASTSNTSMERIINEGGGRQWFHLYIWRDMEASLEAVPRAKAAGFEALILTVDSTVPYNREFDVRNSTSFPVRITSRNIFFVLTHPRWLLGTAFRYVLAEGHLPKYVNINIPENLSASSLKDFLFKNDSLNWEFLKKIREMWPNKLIVKGVMHPSDAAKCLEIGADAIVVSNHGGIASDAALASIDVLPEIKREVGDRISVIVDSGFRRGSDILKGLALGADAVIIGRATLYGAAAAGEDGAYRALDILQKEILRTMGVMGLTNLKDISRGDVVMPHEYPL